MTQILCFDFWFRYLYEVFCDFFSHGFCFVIFGLFSHLLVQTGVLGFYIVTWGLFSYIF